MFQVAEKRKPSSFGELWIPEPAANNEQLIQEAHSEHSFHPGGSSSFHPGGSSSFHPGGSSFEVAVSITGRVGKGSVGREVSVHWGGAWPAADTARSTHVHRI